MKLCKFMGIAFLAVGITQSAWADEQKSEVKIFGGIVENLFDIKGQGPYNKLLDSLFLNSPYKLKISYSGYKRANRSFISDKNSCHFVASDTPSFYKTLKGLDVEKLVFSNPINQASLRVYSLFGAESVGSLNHLKGHSVLVDSPAMNSLGLYIEFPEDVTWLTTNSAAKSYDLLIQKRGHHIIAYDVDMVAGIGADYYKKVVWDPALTLRSLNEVMVCHDTNENKKFISYFNKKLREIKENGQWKELFPKSIFE